MQRTRNTNLPVIDRSNHGLDFAYGDYLRLQERLRRRRRELLFFCSHPPTLTAGVKSRAESLLLEASLLRERGIEHVRIGRGGDYTAHEPGQCVIYPHVDLRAREIGVSAYFAGLLEITAETLKTVWNLETENHEDAPGLYTPGAIASGGGRKLASIGIMFKSFFASFGVAVNVHNSLETFQYINPCGDANLSMTTVSQLGGEPKLLSDFTRDWTIRFNSWLARHSATAE